MDCNKIDVEFYLKISAELVAYKEKKTLWIHHSDVSDALDRHIERLESVIEFIEKFASEEG